MGERTHRPVFPGLDEVAERRQATIDLLGVPVETVCVGRAEGSAVGVVAAAPRRQAARHARFRLSEPTSSVAGRAAELDAWAEHHQAQLARFAERPLLLWPG